MVYWKYASASMFASVPVSKTSLVCYACEVQAAKRTSVVIVIGEFHGHLAIDWTCFQYDWPRLPK